jgi:glycosyltransferase involved in cell wall biosynthesis
VDLSVVVPCFNEESVVELLVVQLRRELSAITQSFEVILVDDGSTDGTLGLLRRASQRDGRFRYFALSRNFGKESAMLAGLSQARGEAVAIMDADLQHPPHLLAQMLPHLGPSCHQVVARRTRAGDAPVRSLASRAYYRVMNRLVEVRLEDGVGDFRVLSRTAVRALLSLGERNRFSKGLFAWIGFDTAIVDYENVTRESGRSKWRLRDLVNYGIDGVLSFNTRPLRAAIHFGAVVSAVAFLYAIWIVGKALVNGVDVPGYVTIMCAVIGFGGLQLILLGVIGEYLGRIYAETKARPHFLVQESSDGMGTAVTVALGPEHEQHLGEAHIEMPAPDAELA